MPFCRASQAFVAISPRFCAVSPRSKSRAAQLLDLIPQLLRLVAQVLQRVGARAVRAALVAGRITRRAALARELNLEVTVVVIVGRRHDPVGIDNGRRTVVGQDHGVRKIGPARLEELLGIGPVLPRDIAQVDRGRLGGLGLLGCGISRGAPLVEHARHDGEHNRQGKEDRQHDQDFLDHARRTRRLLLLVLAILRDGLGILTIRLARISVARLVARLCRARHICRLLRLRNGILQQVIIRVCRRVAVGALR